MKDVHFPISSSNNRRSFPWAGFLLTALFVVITDVRADQPSDYMLIAGGGFHPREIEIYHPDSQTQEILEEPKFDGNGMMYHSATMLDDNRLLVAGGRDPKTKIRLKSAYIFELNERRLVRVADTKVGRSGAAAATLNNEAYICGGLSGQTDRRCATSICEKFDGEKWVTISPMKQDRAIFAMAAHGNYLYAIGGEINNGTCDSVEEAEKHVYKVLNAVERYNPNTDQWESVTNLTYRRYAHAAVAHNNKIYACGGHFDPNYKTHRTSGCEAYDPLVDKWSEVKYTVKPRAGLSMVVMNEKMYVIGGAAIPLTNEWFDYDYTPFTLEEWDPSTETWKLHKEFLQKRAYGASVNSVNRVKVITPRVEQIVGSGGSPNCYHQSLFTIPSLLTLILLKMLLL